jgi:hypothetical protein
MSGNYPKLIHTFLDEENAVIPFFDSGPVGGDGTHIVGGMDAITGRQDEGFRVLVSFENNLELNDHRVKIKDIFIGTNYPGEHPLKKAKKLVIALR